MTWADELAALTTGGVIAAVVYWFARRVEQRLGTILTRLDEQLTKLLALLDGLK